jgi:hypothetical protein
MNLWRIALFDNRSDGKPSRIGYLFADSQEAASNLASAQKPNGVRMDVRPTIMRPASMTAGDREIFWDD